MKNKLFLVLIALLVVAGITVGAPRPAFTANSDLIISEINLFPGCVAVGNSCAGDDNNQTLYEWVEIHNKGNASVDINGWKICNKTPGTNHANCDFLASSSLEIGPGEYWVVANANDAAPADYLTQEFNLYGDTVDNTKTIFIGSPIGAATANVGLSSVGDAVFIITNESTCGPSNNLPCVTDCVSWDATNTCAALVNNTTRAYLIGSEGAETTAPSDAPLPGIYNGQSIANIAGTWYQHGPDANIPNQASPYVSNTAEGGVTAVSLSDFSANSATNLLIAAGALLLAGGLGLLVLRRQKS